MKVIDMKFMKIVLAVAFTGLLAACGQRVEVPPAHVGKIMTSNGYKEGTMPTSRFRLAACLPFQVCEKLVVMNSGDVAMQESMELVMPKDKLKMNFTLQTTLTINDKRYDEVFNRVAPKVVDGDAPALIDRNVVYVTYARQIILSETREYLSQYSISEVLSNLPAINQGLQDKLTKSISERTPFVPRFVGLADVKYPDIIVAAQEAAAQRREQIEQEEAQLEISKVQLQRELQEQQMRRKVQIEKAQAEAQVNMILAASVTPAYEKYRQFEALDKMAEGDNKVFVPVGALNSIAIQRQIGQ